MKASLPPMLVLVPAAPVTAPNAVTAVARVDASLPSQQQLPTTLSQHATDAEHREREAHGPKGHSKGAATFRSPRQSAQRNHPPPRLTPNRPGPVRSRPARPAQQPNAADGEFSIQTPQLNVDEIEEDFDTRRAKAAFSMQTQSMQDQGSERGGTDEGGHQERRFKSMRMSLVMHPQHGETSPAVAQALKSLRAANAVEDLARPMRTLVRDAETLAGHAPLQSLVFRAAINWLERLATTPTGVSGGATTLREIRSALIEGAEGALADLTEQQATANLWLPIYLLNLDRPRTAQQRQQAIERLDMIERQMDNSAKRHLG